MVLARSRILYLGLGEMGYRIAGTLSKQFAVSVWNRTNSKATSHAAEFNTMPILGSNPFAHDISDIDFFMSCLPTSCEVSHYTGLLLGSSSVKPGAIWIDNTSGVPSASQQIAKQLSSKEVGFIDAPVSGGRKGATAGSLSIMVGGASSHFARASEILSVIGNKIKHIDEKVGSGHAVKGVNNLLYACHLLLGMKVAQALESSGIDPVKGLSAVQNSSGGSTAMNRIIEYVGNQRTTDYSFKTNLLVKDMGIGLELVERSGGDSGVVQIFESVQKIYTALAQEQDWENSVVFDAYGFIEK